MKLDELGQAEKVAARVYIRNRRKAWEHFYFLQDLKIGDYLHTKDDRIVRVQSCIEDYDASPLDIVVLCHDVNTGAEVGYGFSIRAFECNFMQPLLKWHNKGFLNSYEAGLKLSKEAKLIYENRA